MDLSILFLKFARKIYDRYISCHEWARYHIGISDKVGSRKSNLYESSVELFDQEANDYCLKVLERGKPCMISKFGTVELAALVQHRNLQQSHYSLQNYFDFIRRKRVTLWWNEGVDALCKLAGFFPNDNSQLVKFHDEYVRAMKKIDILGSYLEFESYFSEELKSSKKINLDGYYAPFFYKNPWTKALTGKRVLVIHPFVESIKKQYANREGIWENKDLLPDFELLTIKAEQTIFGEKPNHSDWFKALDSMKAKMEKMNFDIVLVGAGAYGMPLAAHAKMIGKQAIHLAGWTQVLFGIKGKRWVDMPSVSKFMNDYWQNPMAEEMPKNYKKVEDGCYW